jgi:hypothetical protein
MWIINGVQPSTGWVRQHWDLSYWMSGEEIVSVLGRDASSGRGPWPATPEIEGLIAARRRIHRLQANFDEEIGVLQFFIERKDDWEPLVAATWADDEAEAPGDPLMAARAGRRDIIWNLEGFDLTRGFMVEDFELSHRISEAEILAALGNPPAPYYGGLPPTETLADLIAARIGLDVHVGEVELQINSSSRYGPESPRLQG